MTPLGADGRSPDDRSPDGAVSGAAALSASQRGRLAAWLPGFVVEHDHSWGVLPTRVLEVAWRGERYIVKAAPPGDRHLTRELQAHRQWLSPWRGVAPELVFAADDASLLVTRFVPGELVLRSNAIDDPDVFRQAGVLLAALHDQGESVVDAEYEARANARLMGHLAGEHGIAEDVVEAIRRHVHAWDEPPVTLVPTHGDWQPRNWVWTGERVAPIDFGRAALRPAMTDWIRVAVQDFSRIPALETAFIEGYGRDPREPIAWAREYLREAVGTTVFASQTGDTAFEAQGTRMIAAALDLLDGLG